VSHIYENPVETEMDLIARILPMCVNVQKYVRYICALSQRSLCVTCRITMKSQADSSTTLFNYMIIFPLKFTTVNEFYEYICNNTKKIVNVFQAGIF
jgi:hypothetical protein